MQCIVPYATGMYSKLSQIRFETSQYFLAVCAIYCANQTSLHIIHCATLQCYN